MSQFTLEVLALFAGPLVVGSVVFAAIFIVERMRKRVSY